MFTKSQKKAEQPWHRSEHKALFNVDFNNRSLVKRNYSRLVEKPFNLKTAEISLISDRASPAATTSSIRPQLAPPPLPPSPRLGYIFAERVTNAEGGNTSASNVQACVNISLISEGEEETPQYPSGSGRPVALSSSRCWGIEERFLEYNFTSTFRIISIKYMYFFFFETRNRRVINL